MYESPFWIALFEDFTDGFYSVAREIIDTSEPGGKDLLIFFDNLNYDSLKFSKRITCEKSITKKYNYKRQIRLARKSQSEDKNKHVYTKAHALIKELKSEIKAENKKQNKHDKKLASEHKFNLKQLKKKEKHKGH